MLAVGLMASVALVLLLSYLLIDSPHREKVIGFWLVSISTAVTYIAIDVIAGAMLITPLSPELVPDDIRHHKLVPDAYAKFEQQDFSYVQRNNAFGLRGNEITIDKPKDTFRILTLGDSFTMGKGVEDDQTFSALMQDILNEKLGSCDARYERIEVLNGGVDSYAPILSSLYLTQALHVLGPDLVILNLDNSDLIQEAAYRMIAIRDDRGEIMGVPGNESKKRLSDKFRSWIESNLYITRVLLFYTNKFLGHKDLTVRGVVERANAEVIAHTLESDHIDRTAQWADVFASLAKIQDFADSREMEFLVTLYPWAHQVSDGEWLPGRFTYLTKDDRPIEDYDEKILGMAVDRNIAAVSLYDAFENYSGTESLYFDNDPHFTTHGHELMAGEIARYLVEKDFVAAWCR
jgi:lysophospholipase L1-like esterase